MSGKDAAYIQEKLKNIMDYLLGNNEKLAFYYLGKLYQFLEEAIIIDKSKG